MRRVLVGTAILGGVLAGGLWLGHAGGNARLAAQDKKEQVKKEQDKQTQESKQKTGTEPKKDSIHTFMRKKLAAAQDILEGLATEDYEMIGRGAKLLKSLGEKEEFVISKDMVYQQHMGEFVRIVTKMEKAANEKKLDNAALQYVDLTMNCIECHRFVRDVLVAGDNLPSDAEFLARVKTRRD